MIVRGVHDTCCATAACEHGFASDGADALKLDAVQLKPQGYSLVAKEVVSVLAEFDVLDKANHGPRVPV
jgi:hypothetical protein